MDARTFAIAGLLFFVATSAVANEPTGNTYSQDYVLANPGFVTVVCPDDRLPTDWYLCVPEAHGEGSDADNQVWIGGAGIDMPIEQVPVHIRVEDASGMPVPAAFCVDHDHDALCGPSDPVWEAGDEGVIFFCGETDVPVSFDSTPPPGRTLRHMDVWVRNVGHTGAALGTAPLCEGIGTLGTVYVTAI